MTSRRRALLIGNALYDPNEPKLSRLRCPHNDVAGLAELLGSEQHGDFQVESLIDEAHDTIERSLYDLLINQAGQDDLVLLYYSGHGKPNSRGELHLATRDTQLRYLPLTSIPLSRLSTWMQDSRASQIVLILDCCYSGSFEQIMTKGEIAAQIELTLPNQLKGRGTYVLTASTDTELAAEKEGDEYSLLTKYIIRGIRDGAADRSDTGYITMQDLTAYVQESVALENAAQTPQGYALRIEGGALRLCKTGRSAGAGRIAAVSRVVYDVASTEHIPYWITRRILDLLGDGKDPTVSRTSKDLGYVDRLYQSRHERDQFLVIMQDIAHQEGLEAVQAPNVREADNTQQPELSESKYNRLLGIKCYHAGDYDAALHYLKIAAEGGDGAAMESLGIMYHQGQGVIKNVYIARQWYLKAAEKDMYGAMLNLGAIYDSLGEYSQAAEWFQKAADGGDSDAMVNLATMYRDGEGVDRDYVKARDLFTTAAVKGNNATAMERLGDLCRDGHGGQPDISAARIWYKKASALGRSGAVDKLRTIGCDDASLEEQHSITFRQLLEAAKAGDPEAAERVGEMYLDGVGVVSDVTDGVHWYKKAAERGNATAMAHLGFRYATGKGIAVNYPEARKWLEQAVAANSEVAGPLLATLLLGGLFEVSDIDRRRAFTLLESAADKGNELAMHELGTLYEEGSVHGKDLIKARAWYKSAAERNHVNSMVNLGVLLCRGGGGERDYVLARRWFLKAAEAGDADAMVNLGYIHEDGLGVTRDKEEARIWFQRAVKLGNRVASEALARPPVKSLLETMRERQV
jgi:TPR repeat protein